MGTYQQEYDDYFKSNPSPIKPVEEPKKVGLIDKVKSYIYGDEPKPEQKVPVYTLPQAEPKFRSPTINEQFNVLDPAFKEKALEAPQGLITSAARTPERNAEVGGVPNSFHTKGMALDYALDESTPAVENYWKSQGYQTIKEKDHLHVEPSEVYKSPNGFIGTYAKEYDDYFANAKPVKQVEKIEPPSLLSKVSKGVVGAAKEVPGALDMVRRGVTTNIAHILNPVTKNIPWYGDVVKKVAEEPPTKFEEKHNIDINAPLIPYGEEAELGLDTILNKTGMGNEAKKYAKAVARPVLATTSGLTSPPMLATIAAGGVAPSVGKVLAGSFAPMLAEGVTEGTKKAYEGFKEGDYPKALEGGVETAISGAFLKGSMEHGFGKKQLPQSKPEPSPEGFYDKGEVKSEVKPIEPIPNPVAPSDVKPVTLNDVAPLTTAKEVPVEPAAPIEPTKPLYTREQLQADLQKKGYQSKEQAKVIVGINDVVANAWAKRTGRAPEEWYHEHLGGFEEGGKPTGGALKQEENPIFYSQLQKTLEEKMPNKASPEQVRGIVKTLKPEEIEWSGLNDFLNGKSSVSKQELLNHLKENEVQVEEVVKGGNNTKFSEYQEPGGENYRELLLKLPDRESSSHVIVDKNTGEITKKFKNLDEARQFYSKMPQNQRLDKQIQPEKNFNEFKSSHFEEPNIIVHIRMNDRMIDGKKAIFFEEVQSDHHQKGRKEGYDSGQKAAAEKASIDYFREREVPRKADNGKITWKFYSEYDGISAFVLESDRVWRKAYPEEMKAIENSPDWKFVVDIYNLHKQLGDPRQIKSVPDAPFKKTWHELALKRMLRYAADNGYEKIAWTTGDQQAARYDLSKHVKDILWQHHKDGTFSIEATIEDGRPIVQKKKTASELEAIIGKEATQKIVDGVGKFEEQMLSEDRGRLSNLDLKVGGEGMKGFYDQILPASMNKLVKKYGGKVGESSAVNPESNFKYEGPVYTLDQLEAARKIAAGFDNKNITSPLTGEKQQYIISRTSVENPLRRIITDMKKGDSFHEAVEKNANGDVLNLMGGKIVPIEAKVKVHSVDLPEELKQSVKQGQPLFQKEGTKAKGWVEFQKDGKAIIHAMKSFDASTGIHELAHIWRRTLEGEVLKRLEDSLGVKDGKWKREHEEAFAKAGEKFASGESAPTPELVSLFTQFREWLKDIYKGARGLNVKVSKEMQDAFNWLFGKEELSPELKAGLEHLRNEVASSQFVKRYEVDGEWRQGSGTTLGDTRNGGGMALEELGSKKNALAVIDNVLSEKNLTGNQWDTWFKIKDHLEDQRSRAEALDRNDLNKYRKVLSQIEEATKRGDSAEVERLKDVYNALDEPVNFTSLDLGALINEATKDSMLRNEIGAIGDRSVNEQAKMARAELYRRVSQYAKDKGVSLSKAAEELGIPENVLGMMSGESIQNKDKKQNFIGGTGLETGKVVQGRIAFRPDKINGVDDIQNLIQDISKDSNQFKDQRVSKTDKAVVDLANTIGINVDDLLAAKPGSVANAETVYRAREIVMNLAQDLRDYTKTFDTVTATPEQLTEFNKKYFRLMGAMKAVAGFRTESSNLFRQFKQKISPNEDTILRDLIGDIKKVDKSAGDDLAAFTRKAKELSEPTVGDKIWHLWYASNLSGWSTHLKNAVGSLTNTFQELGRVATTQPKEFPSALQGAFQGLMQGTKDAGKVLREGDISKFQERGIKPVVFTGKLSFLNAADYVGRALAATDALFKGGFKGMEARGLAREQAVKEGLKGKVLRKRISDLYEEKYQSQEAEAFSLRGTYNQKPAGVMGLLSDAISGVTNAKAETLPGKAAVTTARLVVPFTRVVANVVNAQLDWTPVGIMRGVTDYGKAAEGQGRMLRPHEINTERQRYQQISRGVLGTMAMGYFAHLAVQGQLTGNGPSDWNKKKQWLDAGNRENSLKIGDTFYPVSNWGPIAGPMVIVGNYYDAIKYNDITEDELTKRLSVAMMGSVNSIMNMSFLRGTSELMAAINDSKGKGAKYLLKFPARQISSVVPNFVKQTDRLFDPTVYEQNTFREMIQNNLRITSGLRPSLNVWGEVVKGDAITQMSPSKETSDHVKKYLADNDLWVSEPSKNTKIIDMDTLEKRAMTSDEYYKFVKLSGPLIKERIEMLLDVLPDLEKEDQQALIDKHVNKVRDQTKKLMLVE